MSLRIISRPKECGEARGGGGQRARVYDLTHQSEETLPSRSKMGPPDRKPGILLDNGFMTNGAGGAASAEADRERGSNEHQQFHGCPLEGGEKR